MRTYRKSSSVIIRRREGLVPLDEAHLSHSLWIDGNFEGHYESYDAAATTAQRMTGLLNEDSEPNVSQ